MGPDGMSMVNGTTGVHGEEYWTDGGNMSQVRPSSPQAQAQGQSQAQPQRQVSDVYSNTLPVRRPAPAKNKNPVGKSPRQRSKSKSAGTSVSPQGTRIWFCDRRPHPRSKKQIFDLRY